MLAKSKECDDTMEAKWFKHVGLVITWSKFGGA